MRHIFANLVPVSFGNKAISLKIAPFQNDFALYFLLHFLPNKRVCANIQIRRSATSTVCITVLRCTTFVLLLCKTTADKNCNSHV